MLQKCCESLRNSLKNPICLNHQIRKISNSEIATALRPFYFAVHPDLFAQHPQERHTNEESLKQLSAYLEIVQRPHIIQNTPKVLKFYVRNSLEKRDSFKLVIIPLEQNTNAQLVIQRILKSCNISTDFIDKIKNTQINNAALSNFGNFYSGNHDFHQENEKQNYRVEKTLVSWLKENAEIARNRDNDLDDLKTEVQKLQDSLSKRLGIEVRYDCGWNYEHFRGCLKSLERLADMHEKDIEKLKGRIVVFASFTGVSLEGHLMLFTGDVLSNWLDFINNIPKHDVFLKKIPLYEKALSQVLLNIKVRRRKFMPKQQVIDYAEHLSKVTTTLLDYLSTNKFPKSWQNNLSNHEIVIESEAGPLMVSPTGQFITPATIPGFLLIDFITNNLNDAIEKADHYQKNKFIERELHKKCIDKLNLKSLTKDDSVTPEKMIKTLERLLSHGIGYSSNLHLNITNYYSVLTDGTVCIPWDFIPE